jgi:hypothetical protein
MIADPGKGWGCRKVEHLCSAGCAPRYGLWRLDFDLLRSHRHTNDDHLPTASEEHSPSTNGNFRIFFHHTNTIRRRAAHLQSIAITPELPGPCQSIYDPPSAKHPTITASGRTAIPARDHKPKSTINEVYNSRGISSPASTRLIRSIPTEQRCRYTSWAPQ